MYLEDRPGFHRAVLPQSIPGHACGQPLRMQLDMQSSLGLLALVTLVLGHSSPTVVAQKGKRPADPPPIAATLGAYLEARASGEELEGARSALAVSLAELAKARGGDPLEYAADLGRALGLTRARPGERGGKVQTG